MKNKADITHPANPVKQNNRLAKLLNLYGSGLYKFGKIEESVPVFKEAAELNQRKDTDIPQRYCRVLYEAGRLEEAFAELQIRLKAHPLNEEMRNLFKKVNQEHKGTEEGFGSFLGKAEKEYRAKLKKEIKGQALELPAPAFSLKDLDGNTVSLSDYKDKIVVLDFWATWCVRSFPAMQKSVNKYRDDDNVEFLFIDTWENGKDVEKNVRKIIGKNNYPFHVLMDVDGSMTDAYKVFALPTKMIIGPGGNIRFRIRGFDSDSQLIEELDLMIAMLR